MKLFFLSLILFAHFFQTNAECYNGVCYGPSSSACERCKEEGRFASDDCVEECGSQQLQINNDELRAESKDQTIAR